MSQLDHVNEHGLTAAFRACGNHPLLRDGAGGAIDDAGSQLGAAGIDPDECAHGKKEGATPKTRRQVSPPTLRMSYVEPAGMYITSSGPSSATTSPSVLLART